jgi:hypothetical protein
MQGIRRFVAILTLLLALPTSAAAQAFWDLVLDTRSGGQMLIYHGKLAPRADGYTHVLYAATPERPDGHYWFMFRRECTSGAGGETWGFLPWNGGLQQGASLFDQLLPEWKDEMLSELACRWVYTAGLEDGLWTTYYMPTADGVPEVLSNLRTWQAQQP